ncbi:winged helix-turn-helix domain-containing protein [Ureaplasma diversum]|nr:winged helix-turn-helix domain-containing protein [Ureaplasma diversum]
MTNKSYIVRYIILKIAMGVYPLDALIPSENKLANNFDCGRITVHNAYETLKDLDILHTIKGSGFYVKTMIDSYINQTFANLYPISTNATVNTKEINYSYCDILFKHATSFSLLIRNKTIARSCFLSTIPIDVSNFDPKNINISKLIIMSGNDDFFNVKTTISYDLFKTFEGLLSFDKFKINSPLIVNYLYNSNNELCLIIITQINDHYFKYTSASKLI